MLSFLLRYTDSDYLFGILKLFFKNNCTNTSVKISPVVFSLADHEVIWTLPLIGFCQMLINRIDDVIVSVLASSVVDRVKPKTMKLVCVASPHVALRSKSKYWLARNQNNVSEWSDISILGLLFQ